MTPRVMTRVSVPQIISMVTAANIIQSKFERFAREQVFSDQDTKDYLCWVLVGKAAEYYTLLVRQNRVMTYTELMTHMERRFAARQLRDTALLHFQNARQQGDDSIEEWADRIHHLTLFAFEQVPGASIWHGEKDQMILRFCTGCTDRAAGLHATKMHARSIGEATTHILKYQFNHAAVYGPREDGHKSEATIRALQSREAYNGGHPPAHEDYRRQYAPSQRPRAYYRNGPPTGFVPIHLAGTGRPRGIHKSGDTSCLPRGPRGTAMNGPTCRACMTWWPIWRTG
ncbi:hypothetical protein PoB_005166600 [Plakobranchus ocellatus]|uniref:Retrotransposon gag domain-containing protein n=1 Tax=Plakobranchus ocellatus TaxID=259542 RepID=A0AAV4BXA4_9GAST|nr:hypothetical protein PoB_005166600 [Plakobranchus ocellatus]